MWQAVLAGLIVLVATLYAVWALMPPATRTRLARSVTRWSRRGRRRAWLARAGEGLEKAARSGGCEDCSASQAVAKPPREERGPER